MNRGVFIFVVLALTSLAWGDPAQQAQFAPDRVIVRFKPEKMRGVVKHGDRTPLRTIVSGIALPAGVAIEEGGFAQWARAKHKEKTGKAKDPWDLDFSRFMYLKLPKGTTPDQMIELLRKNPAVEQAEKVALGRIGGVVVPDDTLYTLQWSLAGATGSPGRVWAPEAWGITTGTSDVIVAVLDTGVNTNLSEFAGRNVPGYRFVLPRGSDALDDKDHGTSVSSIIAANSSNATDIAGIDWHCKIMPLKVADSAGNSFVADWYDAIDFAITNGAKIINLSSGTLTDDPTLRSKITNAIAHGLIFVSITHNQGVASLQYPAGWPEAIAVGAIDPNGVRWSMSNYGANIDLVAPGVNVYALSLNGSPGQGFGTSFAGPHVAGAAALLCSIKPDLNQEQVRTLLCAGADDQVGGTDTNNTQGYDLYYGWGQLNIYQSLQLLRTSMMAPVVTNSTDMLLQWQCPTNAARVKPYVVQYTNTLGTNWQESTNITHGTNMAKWVDNTATNDSIRFYRLKLRSLTP